MQLIQIDDKIECESKPINHFQLSQLANQFLRRGSPLRVKVNPWRSKDL